MGYWLPCAGQGLSVVVLGLLPARYVVVAWTAGSLPHLLTVSYRQWTLHIDIPAAALYRTNTMMRRQSKSGHEQSMQTYRLSRDVDMTANLPGPTSSTRRDLVRAIRSGLKAGSGASHEATLPQEVQKLLCGQGKLRMRFSDSILGMGY